MPSLHELLAIFPEAKSIIMEKIAESKRQLIYYRDQESLAKATLKKWSDREELKTTLLFYDHMIENEIKIFNKYQFALKPTRKIKGGITDDDISRAKEVPIEDLYDGKLRKVGGRLVGRCPFHEEKTGSFTIYIDQNSFYCYAECKGGSSIDYIMFLNNCNFVEAVKFLIKK